MSLTLTLGAKENVVEAQQAKLPVFSHLKRNCKDYTKVIPDAKGDTLQPVIREAVDEKEIICMELVLGTF